jgi:hypothetical protein
MAAARSGSAASATFSFASKALAISGVIFTGAGAKNICTALSTDLPDGRGDR